ncbi:MAG: PKD domain-containing protein, partial [Acidimicrobiia bacterium]
MFEWRSALRFRRSVVGLIALVVAAGVPFGAEPALALVPGPAPTETAALAGINLNLGLSTPPIIDPSGITYFPLTQTFLVADSEVDEEVGNPTCVPPLPATSTGDNMFEIDLSGTVIRSWLSPEETVATNKEPTGLAYGNGHVFISNDNQDRVYEMSAGLNGVFDGLPAAGGDDVLEASFSTNVMGVFNAADPEDVAFDTTSGDLFIAGGIGSINREVFRINAGVNGVFDGVPADGGDDVISSFGTAIYGLQDLEGIEYRASSDTLLVVDAGMNESVNEFTKDGFLLRRIDISEADMTPTIGFVPSDVTLAPSSDTTDDPTVFTMYIVDRGDDNGDSSDCVAPPMDGRLYEMSAPFTDLPPFVDAGIDQTVTLSAGATLDGLVADDGQPTPGGVTAAWSVVTAPAGGMVIFAAASNPDTTATFSVVGTYELALTGDDGPQDTTDTVLITVDPDPVVNQAPLVSAGADQTVTLSAGATLDGSVSDDGLPNPPAATTATWTKFSGPGDVIFTDASNPDTTASFSAVGTYVLRLTGDDTALQTSDDVQITVNPNPGGGGGGAPPPPTPGLTCGNDVFSGAPPSFTDLAGLSDEAVHAIDCLAAYLITTGTGPGTFSPHDQVARWQMAAFLIRQAVAQGVAVPSGTPHGFTDLEGLD